MKDALHLCMQFILSDLPPNAHVLCVGVGTGAELLYLAAAFPQWRFTVVEPSAQMLAVCRTRAEAQSISSRCDFREEYVEALPDIAQFDAATAILVSHYLGDQAARQDFFHAISTKLRPGGVFISADLAADTNSQEFAELFRAWKSMLRFSDMSSAEVERYSSKFSKGGPAIPVPEIETIFTSSGFQEPVLFCQTLLIHAWYSRRCD